MLALDPAASECYKDGKYVFKKSDNTRAFFRGNGRLLDDWCTKYPIISIEDGMAAKRWSGRA